MSSGITDTASFLWMDKSWHFQRQPESHCRQCPSRNHRCLSYQDDIYHPDIFIEMQVSWQFTKYRLRLGQFIKASGHLTVMDPWEKKAEVEETKRKRRRAKAPSSLILAPNYPSPATTDWSCLRVGLAYHLLSMASLCRSAWDKT